MDENGSFLDWLSEKMIENADFAELLQKNRKPP
jgi:hypothetical protein